MAIFTTEYSHLIHPINTPFNLDGLAVNNAVCNFLMSAVQDIAKSLSGYIHLSGSLFMIQFFQICQSECLIFVERQNNLA
jgi:hypothetical protein